MTNPLFVFFGTPYIATVVLDRLEAHGLVPTLVVTAPDKPSGRRLVMTPTPVKLWAMARGIDVATPKTLKDTAFIAELQNTSWDVFIVSMYAKIIPKPILEMPVHGCLNVHPSLLPKFRGPSPVLSAILEDERATGVTIMQLDEKMDEGPIVAQAKIELEEEAPTSRQGGWPPKGSEFEQLLAQIGGDLLAEVMPLWVEGKITPEVQDHPQATYTKKFTDADAQIDIAGFNFDVAAQRKAFLQIRAFDKSPRAYFVSPAGKRVIITDAQWEDGRLVITRVIPEGKKEMLYADFCRGTR